MMKIFSVITAICLIGSLIGINLLAQPVDGQSLISDLSVEGMIPGIISFIIAFIPIGLVEFFLKIVGSFVMLFSFIEPFFKYIQSVAGGAILEYLTGYKDLIYYGFIRPLFMDIWLEGFYIVFLILCIIGLIPIISIPIALIVDFLIFYVHFLFPAAILGYFPSENLNPLAQGMLVMKNSFTAIIGIIFLILALFLCTIYTIGMIIPFLNIITTIITFVVFVLDAIIICPLFVLFAWIMNSGFILPTIFNHTPFISLIERGIWRMVVMLEDLIFKGIDNLGGWIA